MALKGAQKLLTAFASAKGTRSTDRALPCLSKAQSFPGLPSGTMQFYISPSKALVTLPGHIQDCEASHYQPPALNMRKPCLCHLLKISSSASPDTGNTSTPLWTCADHTDSEIRCFQRNSTPKFISSTSDHCPT